MKKLQRIVLFVLLAGLLAAPAVYADLIIEPRGDSFYNTHGAECNYLYRQYTANGVSGYVSFYKSPLKNTVQENVFNGETFSCSFLYTDESGAVWGGVNDDQNYSLRGWVRLSDCVAVPDYLSFAEAHRSEFISYDGAYDDTLHQADRVVLWKYPGSGVIVYEADNDWFDEKGADYFSQCYRDGDGRFWAYVGYCYGIRNTWLCLSDPQSTDIPADPDILPAGPELIPPAGELPAADRGFPLLAAGLTLGVVCGTAVLIRVLFRPQ